MRNSLMRLIVQLPLSGAAKKHGVSAQTIYGWRKHFGTLEPVDVKRLRQLERKMGGSRGWWRPGSRDRRPEGDHPKGIVGARVRRQQLAYAQSRGLSGRRRACALLSVARSSVGYVSRLQARDALVVRVMRELAGL
jgi:putative transposase